MTLWLILALMTAVAIVAVIWPLVQNGNAARSGSDVAVYRDQLDEVERDLAAGTIGKTEAEAARVEISRRLLAAADAAKAGPALMPAATAWYRRAGVIVAVLFLPIGAGSLYLRIGSPGLASETLVAQREGQPNRQAGIENLVAKVEEHLQNNPKDGRGWEVLAPVYMQLGRYADAVDAWRNALKFLGESADRQANLGEALMAQANGAVTAEAQAAFTRAVSLDGTTVSARYYLGVAAEQDGKREEAAKIWRDLIADAPAGARWVSDVRAALARVEGKAAAPLPGPTPAQMAAAANQSPDQQTAMIQGMVDGLAARLKTDGSDVDGWVRLVRSYKVLGQRDKAQSAIADAQRAVAGDPDKRQRLDVALKELEAGSGPAPANSPAQPPIPAAPPPQHDGDSTPSMVEKLAERLKKSGSDPEGWIMLARSYLTFGDKDKAATAIKDARAALAADPDKLQMFNDALRRFKIDDAANAAPAPTASPAANPQVPGQANSQTDEMVRGMVSKLAERLKRDGSDIDGWMRLVRSYVVLGEREKALSAATAARESIGADADKRRRFDEFVKSLDVGG
jgi:cytochrome c-type biogenesis protein CcmH